MKDETASRRFGELVRTALGTGPSRITRAAQKTRLISEANRLEARSSLWPRLGWGISGIAVVATAWVLYVQSAKDNLSARFADRPISERMTVSTQSARPESLAFSDGSKLLLQPNTHARLSHLDNSRAELELNHGAILADIRKRTGTSWTISVGPYSVQVVGTRFLVDWEPKDQVIQVAVEEGRVRVFGGDLDQEGIALDAGARLERRYDAASPRKDVHQSETVEAPPPQLTVHKESAITTSPSPRTSPSAAPAPTAPAIAEPTWLSLANKGSYRDALSLAVKVGFEKLASTVPENDLVVLANTARYSGDAARAREALLKLRQRFPGRSGARLAALYMARISEDLERQPNEAARWLRVFLQESPSGDLAASARVNLMSILLRSGDQAGARAIAKDYLKYHPDGPHAGQAQSLVDPARPD